MKNRIFSIIFSVILLLTCFVPSVFAAENTRTENSMKEFLDPSGRILGVSSKGEWDTVPENSIPAIVKAAETDIDFILLDVKITADGKLIIFSDDTTQRMLDSETVMNISETSFAELSRFNLKYSCGGSNEKVSEEKIPLLTDVLSVAKENDIPLILRCSSDIISVITDELSENNALDMCILMCRDSKKEISTALSQCDKKPHIIGTKRGNVIFAMNAFASFLEDEDAVGIELKTKNRYGINYYKSVVGNYAENLRVIADPTIPEECGFRQDSEKWWNDLIGRGYSVIITDHAELFCEYLIRTDEARDRLQKIYDKYVVQHTLPDFKDDVLNDFKKAYTDAVSMAESLLSDKSACVQELNDCYSALNKAANDININFSALEDGSAGTTITLPRILLCIVFVVAVVAVQIYFFKRRKKEG